MGTTARGVVDAADDTEVTGMTVRVVTDRRRGAVLHVVGTADNARRAPQGSPVRARRGPSGPPRRADDRRWDSTERGSTDG
ncbi:hypothetical protein ACQP08_15480 [Micromonospora zamorensis]